MSKKIIILGNSPVVINLIDELKRQEDSCDITLFLMEPELPYDRLSLADGVRQGSIGSEVYCKDLEYYKGLGIKLMSDKKVVRVNLKKNRLTTEDKQHFEFDFLIVSDMGPGRYPDVKGINKTNVFRLKRLSDMKELIKELPYLETVAVQSNTLAGIAMASALAEGGKEVIFPFAQADLLGDLLDSESAEYVRRIMAGSGIRVLPGNEITEILGDSEAKAIRTKSGKVLATQAVIWGEVSLDLRLFRDTHLNCSKKIPVVSQGRSNVESVFAIGEVCENEKDLRWEDFHSYRNTLESQAKDLVSAMGGQNLDSASGEAEIPQTSLQVGDYRIRLMGQTKSTLGMEERSLGDPDAQTFLKVFVEGTCVKGAFLINQKAREEQIFDFIKQKRDFKELKEDFWDPDEPANEVPEDIGYHSEQASVSQEEEWLNMPAGNEAPNL